MTERQPLPVFRQLTLALGDVDDKIVPPKARPKAVKSANAVPPTKDHSMTIPPKPDAGRMMTDAKKRARIQRLAATLKPEDFFTERFNAVFGEVYQPEVGGTPQEPRTLTRRKRGPTGDEP